MRRPMRSLICLSLFAICASTALSGCARSTRTGAIRARPAPELKSLAGTRADMKNHWATTRSTNLRMLNDSLGRALYLDRPTRLHPGPIPY